ncbi:imelysin family protein [Endozoicomonas numazuensis]|uniref:Imelysin-like domain-containing protein n=1 Tax=Endozoicomonas numazuensis TaxID=1137799 RepID=A0A081NL04_9GAMM|nr:imelysin family protein [Endozoicomonas numazuensis]KEQ19127.1 hypothetical protein GZ78_03730 [Endozoicomonas numazuensis]
MCAVSLSLLLTGCSQDKGEKVASKTRYLNDVIIADLSAMQQRAVQLSQQADRFCSSPVEKNFLTLRDSWSESMSAWQSVEAVSQIYLEENMESWRFQFWPDKKNLIGRKIEALLKKPVGSDLTEESVIVQGLSALEYLLFDPSSGQRILLGEANRCRFLKSVSNTLVLNAAEMVGKWQGHGVLYNEYTSSDPEKQVTVSVLVLNSLDVLSSRLIREIRLPLGKKKVNHYLAESWRSGQSLSNLRHSLSAGLKMTSFVLDGHLSEQDRLIWQQLSEDLSRINREVEQLPASINGLVESHGRGRLIVLNDNLSGLRMNIQKASSALNIPLGFNTNDGD